MDRHPDLNNFASEAAKKGEKIFYCKPCDPSNPNGAQMLSKPEYEYKLFSLSEKDFNEFLTEED